MGWRGGLTALAVTAALALIIGHTLIYRAAERRLRQDLAAAGLAQAPLDIRHLGWSRSEVSLTLGGDARTEPVLVLDRLVVSGGLADVLRSGGTIPGRRDLTVLAATVTVPTAALPSRSGDGRFIWEAPLLRLNALPLGSLSFSDARVRVMAAPLLGRRFDLRLTGQLQHPDAVQGGGTPILAGALALSVPGDGAGAPSLVPGPSAGDLDLGTLEVRAEPGRLTLVLAGAGVAGRLTVREPAGDDRPAAVSGVPGGDSGSCALDVSLADLAAVRPVLAGVRVPHGTLHVDWRRDGAREQDLSAEFTSRDTVPVAGGAPLAVSQVRLVAHDHAGRGWSGDAGVDLRGPLTLDTDDGRPLLSLGSGNVRLSVRDGDWVRPGQGELPPVTVRYDLGAVAVGSLAFTRLMAGDGRLSLGFDNGGWRWTLWPDQGALVDVAGWRFSLGAHSGGASGPEAALSGRFGGDGTWQVEGTGPLSAEGAVSIQPGDDAIPMRLEADRFALRRDAQGGMALSVTGLVPVQPFLGAIDGVGALPPLSLSLTGRRDGGGALTVAGTLGAPGSVPPMPTPLPPVLAITGTLGADGRQAVIDVATPQPAMLGRLSGGAHLRWSDAGPTGRSGWQGDAVVTARQIDWPVAGWSVEDLDGSVALNSLFPPRTSSAQRLTAHRLVMGSLVIDDPVLDVAGVDGGDAGSWRIVGGQGNWAGGVLTVRSGGAVPGSVVLDARGVSLSGLLPGLMAAGYGPDVALTGGLVLDLGRGDGVIRDGTLAAPADTVLHQDRSRGVAPVFDPRRNHDVALLTSALQTMTFDRLAVRIDGPLGAPRLRLVGHGVNPDFYGGYPLDIDVDVSDLSGGP